MTNYVLDLVPGATVEEKAYQVIADGYEEYGYEDVDNGEVTVEGEDHNIEEYETILREME